MGIDTDLYARLETAWNRAHRELAEAFLQKDSLGDGFWPRVQQLEAHAEKLGQAMDTARRLARLLKGR